MVRPWTVNQNRSKALISQWSKIWRGLTQTARDNWNTFASTNPQYAKKNPTAELSGQAAFLKWHLAEALGQGGSAGVVTNPNLTIPANDVPTPSLDTNGIALFLDTTWSLSASQWYANIFLSAPVAESQEFVGSSMRFVVQTLSDDNTQTITVAYTNLFGSLPEVGDIINVGYQVFGVGGSIVQAMQLFKVTVT